jgi:hypothetical protein
VCQAEVGCLYRAIAWPGDPDQLEAGWHECGTRCVECGTDCGNMRIQITPGRAARAYYDTSVLFTQGTPGHAAAARWVRRAEAFYKLHPGLLPLMAGREETV